jgi:hypothetical protein
VLILIITKGKGAFLYRMDYFSIQGARVVL